MRYRLLLVAVCLLFGWTAQAQEKPQAYVGAEILPITGPPIPNGTLIVHRGKIVAVGPAKSVTVPADAERVDVTGKVLMPGLVDSHSHIGGTAGGDGSAPLQPDARVLDSLNVRDAGVQKARAGGITTVNVMPGSGLLSSGQTLYLKLRSGGTIDELLLRDEQGTILGGLKMANGTNSIRTAPMPGTRGKSAALFRELFVKAQDYREKIRRAEGKPDQLPPRDLALETLVEVLNGKRVVHFHTHRHDDILTVLRLQKEFGFRVVLHHVSDGALVAKEIAAAGVPVSLIVIDTPGGKLEAVNSSIGTGLALEQAGVLVGFHTDDSITDSRLFLRAAALAVRGGMSREKALFGLTMANAKILELDKRVGSLEVGKDADFIVLSGDPLSIYSKVLQTFVEGVKVFDRSNPKDYLLAVGGYGASHDQVMHLDCYDDGGDQ
ncbi:MAG: amidohydrolase family protein [Blastocatellia bacterium]|nr:amidohydrolase family protein [Blastocatellia bacterium]